MCAAGHFHFRFSKIFFYSVTIAICLTALKCSGTTENPVYKLQYTFKPADRQADEVRAKTFKPLGRDTNFGFTSKTLWLRFKVDNRTDQPVEKYIGLDYPLIEKAVLYKVEPAGFEKVAVSGLLVEPDKRAIVDHNIAFKVELKPGSTNEYLMSLESGNALVVGSFFIKKAKVYEADVYYSRLILGIYYGILVALLLYNLLVYVFIRDLSFLFYVLYNLGFGAFVASENGLMTTFILNERPEAVLMVIAFSGPFFLTFSALFVRSFLRLREYLPLIGRLLIISAGMTAILSLLAPWVEYRIIILVGTVIATLFWGPLILYAGVRLAINRHTRAVLFMIAWLFFTAGTMIYGLRGLGVLEGEAWSRQAIQAGSAVEMILLSLALGYNMLEMRRKQQIMHERLLTERGRISQDIHDMVGAELTSLLWNLQKEPASLQALQHHLRNTLTQVQDTVYLLKLNDSFSDGLTGRMRDFLKNIDHVRINFTHPGEKISLNEKRAINIYKIFLEWMSNILRHSRPSQVHVELRLTDSRCILCIQDDGRGLQWRFQSEPGSTADYENDTERNGLSNITFRARQINARARSFSFDKINIFILSLRQ